MTLHLSPSGRTCGRITDNSDSPGGCESEGDGPQLISNWKIGHGIAMAACVKDPVLTGASLAGKEDPVTPTTRRTNHQVDDSSSGETKDILRMEHLREIMLREVEKAKAEATEHNSSGDSTRSRTSRRERNAEATLHARSLKDKKPDQASDVPNVRVRSMEVPAGPLRDATSKADPSHGTVREKAQVFEIIATSLKPVLNGPVAPSKAPPPKPEGVPISKQRKMPTPPTPEATKSRKTDEQGTPASSARPAPKPKTPPTRPTTNPLQFDLSLIHI